MSDSEAGTAILPPQGAVKPYDDFLKLLETRKIPKVDKSFLQDHKIASGNEYKLIAGLKFLGLIDKEGNATEDMDGLCVVGEKRRENLAKIVHRAYSILFDVVKIDFEKADPETLINSFKTDYKMGSLTTAERGARIFVFLAQKARIPLSQSLIEKLSVSLERVKTAGQMARKPKAPKRKQEYEPGAEEGVYENLPEEALARVTVRDIGYVDIKDKDTLQIAEAYLKVLSKKLGIVEEGN